MVENKIMRQPKYFKETEPDQFSLVQMLNRENWSLDRVINIARKYLFF